MTAAKLAGTKLDENHGITEATAERLYNDLGGHIVAIAYMQPAAQLHKIDGDDVVTLKVTQLEIVNDPEQAEAIRELARALYRHRTGGQQLAIDDNLSDLEPDVDTTIDRAQAVIGEPEEANA